MARGYFHRGESEQYAFYRTPKILFTDPYTVSFLPNLDINTKIVIKIIIIISIIISPHLLFPFIN